jgi:molecular chaperone DnaK
MIHATRKTLEEVGDEATDEERSAIEGAITDLEASIKDSDLEAIEANTQKLTEASQGLAQKMYAKQAEADQAGAADASEQGSGANEDAVDAEFEEVKDDK